MTSTSTAKAIRRRDEAIVDLLGRLQRHRELSGEEGRMLEQALYRLNRARPKREVWRWTEKEDRMLKALIRRRARYGRPKPFQANDDVRKLAAKFGRTDWAVYRRIERLRKAKCSSANGKRKG